MALMETEMKHWSNLSYEEKTHQLYLKQKALLDQFLERGAITQAQHDKSLHDLTVKLSKHACKQHVGSSGRICFVRMNISVLPVGHPTRSHTGNVRPAVLP